MNCRNIPCPDHGGSMSCRVEYFDRKNMVKPMSRCISMYSCREDLMASVYAQIVSEYYVINGKVEQRKEKHYSAYLSFYRKYYTAKSSINIRRVTRHHNAVIETSVFPATYIRPLVEELSNQYLHEVTGMINYRKGTLVDRCIRVLGWDQIIYEPFSYCMDFDGKLVGRTFPRVVFSTNNMTASKQVKVMRGFSKDTARRGASFPVIRRLLPMSLKVMHHALDTDKYVGKVQFKWNPREVAKWLNLNTGAGIAITKSGSFNHNGIQCIVHDTGKKAYLIEQAIRQVHEFIMAKMKGKPIQLVDLEVIRQKQEWRKATVYTDEELEKLQEKMREFFCPSLAAIIWSELLMRERRKIETGNMVRIGMTFNWGGAYELAKYLHYDDDRMFWVDGDVSQLDKNIQDWMLMLYISCGGRYFPWDEYDDEARECVEFFLKTLMYKISHKIVLHLGNFWQFMRGVMHSGGKDTSHGDSWIMALMFYLYCMDVIDRNPHISDAMMNCLLLAFIIIVVYGDDHIWCAPKIFRPYMSAKGWTTFLAEVCHMTLRDAKEYDSFLSTVNLTSGTFNYRGPVFLKRRFIASYLPNTAPVLPYKEINETMVNLFLKEQDADPIDYMLSCVGQMYDTMGTNVIAYKYVKRFFDKICNYYIIVNPQEALKQALVDPEKRLKIIKYMRRVHLTDVEVLASVPTLAKLQSWHRYDPLKCQFGGLDMPFEFYYE